MEEMTDFIFLSSKITGDSDCSHKIKILAPWKKSYDEPRQHIKIRDIALLTKVHIIKAMVFPVVMYGCGSWTIKKTDCGRIDAFELWCWRRPDLRVGSLDLSQLGFPVDYFSSACLLCL